MIPHKPKPEPHDKLFIKGIWTYAGWLDRIGIIGMMVAVLSFSIRGWLK